MEELKTVKIGLIGDANTGKSSLVSLISDENIPKIYIPTIGVDLRVLYIEDKGLKLSFWDLSGQTIFKDLVDNFVKSMDVICFCFSCDNNDSFTYMQTIHDQYLSNGTLDNKIKILLLTKVDKMLDINYNVAGYDYAKKNNMEFFMTSSIQKVGCSQFITYIVKKFSTVKDENNTHVRIKQSNCIMS